MIVGPTTQRPANANPSRRDSGRGGRCRLAFELGRALVKAIPANGFVGCQATAVPAMDAPENRHSASAWCAKIQLFASWWAWRAAALSHGRSDDAAVTNHLGQAALSSRRR